MWQGILLISVILLSFCTIAQKHILSKKQIDPIGFAVMFQVFTGIVIGILAWQQGFILPNLQPLLLNLFLAVLIYAGANVTLFKALSYIEASSFTILFTTRGIWTILGAIFFLHESFSPRQGFGTLLIIVSILLVFFKKNHMHFDKGIIFGLLTGFFFGIGYVNDAFLVSHFNKPIVFSFLDFILPAIFLVICYFSRFQKTLHIFSRKKSILVQVILLSFIYAIVGITSILAYTFGGKADQIGALSQTTTVMTVLLAIIFLHERDHLPKKLIATIIAFIGVFLLR